MILCLTPNPAIDRTLIVPDLTVGNVHRAERMILVAGGKGLNVARTIRMLGGQPLCMGFVGGHTGRHLAALAQNEGLDSSWTWVDAETRTCTILVSQSGDATVINEPGVPVLQTDWKRLQQDVHNQISSTNLVCVSGSLPPRSSADNLRGLLSMLLNSGKQVWVDTSGTALDAVLTYPGICIKVNRNEISKALGFEIKDVESAKRALIMLDERGISTCVVTLGNAGALLSTNEGRWYAQGPHVTVVSTVGSGDSFLGGFVNALDNGRDYPDALCDAVAAGTANTLSAGGGQFALEEFTNIRGQIRIQAW